MPVRARAVTVIGSRFTTEDPEAAGVCLRSPSLKAEPSQHDWSSHTDANLPQSRTTKPHCPPPIHGHCADRSGGVVSVLSSLDGEALEVGNTLCVPVPSVEPANGRGPECWLNLIKWNGTELCYILMYAVPMCVFFLPLFMYIYMHISHACMHVRITCRERYRWSYIHVLWEHAGLYTNEQTYMYIKRVREAGESQFRSGGMYVHHPVSALNAKFGVGIHVASLQPR